VWHYRVASNGQAAHLAGSPVFGITGGFAAMPPVLPDPACACCAAAACAETPGALPLLRAAASLLVAAPMALAVHAPSPVDFWRLAGGGASAAGACLPELAASRDTCEDSWLIWLIWLDCSPFTACHRCTTQGM
jgi:hypothetical protein